MRPVLWWWISAGHRLALARAGAGVALLVAVAVAGLGLLGGLDAALQAELRGLGGSLRVKPPSLSIGALDLTGGVLPGRTLDEPALQALGQIPGVDAVLPEAWARLPLTLTGSFLGQRVTSEGALLGVTAEALGDEAPPAWGWRPGEVVPVLAPRSLLAAYNGSFAPANGLPRLNDSVLEGLEFTIIAGRSLYGRRDGPTVKVRAEVLGSTRYDDQLAAVVPLDAVRWIEAEAGVDDPGRLSGARLRLAPDADPEVVRAAARGQGWAVDESEGPAAKAAALTRSVQLGLGVAAGALVATLLLGLAQTHALLLRVRAEELRVLRGLGLPAGRLAAGLLGEVAVGVGLAGLVGVAGGLLLGAAAAGPAARALSEWLGIGLQLSARPPGWATAALVLGPAVVACVLAVPGVIAATRRAGQGR